MKQSKPNTLDPHIILFYIRNRCSFSDRYLKRRLHVSFLETSHSRVYIYMIQLSSLHVLTEEGGEEVGSLAAGLQASNTVVLS